MVSEVDELVAHRVVELRISVELVAHGQRTGPWGGAVVQDHGYDGWQTPALGVLIALPHPDMIHVLEESPRHSWIGSALMLKEDVDQDDRAGDQIRGLEEQVRVRSLSRGLTKLPLTRRSASRSRRLTKARGRMAARCVAICSGREKTALNRRSW